MPLDGYVTTQLVRQLSNDLIGAKVLKVMQPSSRELILHLRTAGETHRLLLKADPQFPLICRIDKGGQNPAQAPGFCMLLRKHLVGGILTKLWQPSQERRVHLVFSQRDELGDLTEKTLILEMVGRQSNLILVNREGRILDSLIHVDAQKSRTREVLPARPYVAPPAPNKLDLLGLLKWTADPLTWRHEAESKQPGITLFDWFIASCFGLSPFMAEGLCRLAGGDRTQKISLYTLEGLEKINQRLLDFQAGENTVAAYLDEGGALVDLHALAFPHPRFKTQLLTSCRDWEAAWASLEAQWLERQQEQQIRQKLTAPLKARLKVINKKRQVFEQELKQAERAAQYKLFGDLILANLQTIQAGQVHLCAENYYSDPVEPVSIELLPNRTPTQSAEHYYRLYNKNKRRLTWAKQHLEETQEEQDYLSACLAQIDQALDRESLLAWQEELSQAFSEPALTKQTAASKHQPQNHPGKPGKRSAQKYLKKAYQKQKKAVKTPSSKSPAAKTGPLRYELSEGYTVLIGRNNLQNDQLTLKTAAAQDYWFHRKQAPGPHLILVTGGRTPSEAVITEACELCAWFSLKASERQSIGSNPADHPEKQGAEKIEIDFCPVKQVYKPKGAKPGRVEFKGQMSRMVYPRAPRVPYTGEA